MKKLIVLQVVSFLLLVGLIGCVPPPTLFRIEGKHEITTNPCVFEYNGTVDEIYSMIKRELTMDLFITSLPDDRKSAVLITDFKTLLKHESYDEISFFFRKVLVKLHSSRQEGRLFFTFEDLGNGKVQINFFTTVILIADITVNLDVENYMGTPHDLTHPLFVKYRDIISTFPNVRLIDEG